MKKKYPFIIAITLCALTILSCESKAGTGALVGGGLGAGAGALIGGGQGALIGGAVGVVTGAVVGHMLDESERERVERNSPKTMQRIDNGEKLTVNDIITLHRSGISDSKIKDLIKKTGSTYHLSTETIHRLERAGVSENVINYMISRK
jgi:outer membrane lipoprotein SlyB